MAYCVKYTLHKTMLHISSYVKHTYYTAIMLNTGYYLKHIYYTWRFHSTFIQVVICKFIGRAIFSVFTSFILKRFCNFLPKRQSKLISLLAVRIQKTIIWVTSVFKTRKLILVVTSLPPPSLSLPPSSKVSDQYPTQDCPSTKQDYCVVWQLAYGLGFRQFYVRC